MDPGTVQEDTPVLQDVQHTIADLLRDPPLPQARMVSLMYSERRGLSTRTLFSVYSAADAHM